MNKLKTLLLSAVTLLTVFTPVLAVQSAYAQATPPDCGPDAKCQVCQGAGLDTCNDQSKGTSLQSVIKAAVEILSLMVGIASIIMILIGGFKYVTSGGDSNRVSSAKTTIIFALVGLVIVILSQALVRFVFDKVK